MKQLLKAKLLFLVFMMPSSKCAAAYDFQDISSGLYFSRVTGGVEVVRGESLNRGDITIPSSVSWRGTIYDVVSINENTWQLLYDLKSITMKKGTITVQSSAFYGCTQLSKVELPRKIIIKSLAFSGCSSLADLYTHDMTPTAFVDNCFDTETYRTCKLHVPLGTVNLYKSTAGWKNFYNIVESAELGILLDETADNSSAIIKGKNITTDIQLIRCLSADHWNTFCVPFNVSADQLTSVFGGAALRSFLKVEGTIMKFKVESSIIAGKPYLIQPVNTVTNPFFESARITATSPSEDSYEKDGESYAFVGKYSPYLMETDGTEQFLGRGNLLYIPSETSNEFYGLAAFYRIPWNTSMSAKMSVDVGYNETTGVRFTENKSCNNRIYTLTGQFVGCSFAEIPSGVYVVNRKIVIKK